MKTLILYSDLRKVAVVETLKAKRYTTGRLSIETDNLTIMHCSGRLDDYPIFHGQRYEAIVFLGDFEGIFIEKMQALLR